MDKREDMVLTVKECAQLLKVSPNTVYGMLSDKKEPQKIFAKKVGRAWRITLRELEKFLESEY